MSFKTIADPTFWASVKVTKPGAAPEEMKFLFKHKTRSGLAAWQAGFVQQVPDPSSDDPDRVRTEYRPDREIVDEYIADWEGPINAAGNRDPWSVDAFLNFCDEYHTAAAEVYAGYLKALTESRVKN
jgi:hypothetical protein